MAQVWYSPISEELAKVDEIIYKAIHSNNAELEEMCKYVVSAGGKRVRPSICILSFLAAGGKDPTDAITIGAALEIVHTASLVHDDINDKSEIRRGRKTLHTNYCVSKAIVAGDYLLAKGLQLISIIGSKYNLSEEITTIMTDAASHMSEGEFVQKDFEHSLKTTEEDYYEIINAKTAKLIEACAKVGLLLAKSNVDTMVAVAEYASKIGLAFQIIDDTLDVIGDVNNTGKKIGLDMVEGKPTLPTIIAMKNPVYGEKIKKIFSTPEPSDEDVQTALVMIKKTDAINICRTKADELDSDAIKSISKIPDSVYKESFIELAKFIASRDR